MALPASWYETSKVNSREAVRPITNAVYFRFCNKDYVCSSWWGYLGPRPPPPPSGHPNQSTRPPPSPSPHPLTLHQVTPYPAIMSPLKVQQYPTISCIQCGTVNAQEPCQRSHHIMTQRGLEPKPLAQESSAFMTNPHSLPQRK